jgi:hypothetical protein
MGRARMRLWWLGAATLGLTACGRTEQHQATPVSNDTQPTVPAPGTGPDAKTPLGPQSPPRSGLPEPKSPIDPKSIEAAGQVVQHYGALIEQGRWTASRGLWSSADAAKAFEGNFRMWADVHIEIGELGEPEGAAGSIYMTQPVTFYGKKNGGGNYRREAAVTLRRVNDVPGSTEAQRRWHIQRIDWKTA